MKSITVTLVNQLGLHARAASKLVQTASSFDAEIWVSFQGRRVNAKSIMGVLLLAAPCGSQLLIEAEGHQADQALDAIRGLIDGRFGETT